MLNLEVYKQLLMLRCYCAGMGGGFKHELLVSQFQEIWKFHDS